MRNYHMMGTCHTDLAWHGDEAQYSAYLEQFTVILLDLMEQFPDMTYVIEQAYQYRKLKERRPDLIERLSQRIAEGHLEVLGGMVSTADSNMPCAESIVRNQLMGMRWFHEEMGAVVKTCWLFDSFGSHAQIPQLMASFGLRQMFASRFGGDKHSDVFWAQGLDGTKMLVAGRDCFSPNLPSPERTRVFLDFTVQAAQEDALFASARKTELEGPIMVNTYVEDETFPSRRFILNSRALKKDVEALGDKAEFSLPSRFLDEIYQLDEKFPVVSADLNPEFTGTYAQRIEIRLHNRRTETDLLDAEKWLSLFHRHWPKELHDAWWDMGFVHFHDVFTGSHPENVFLDVISRLDRASSLANVSMESLFGEKITDGCGHRILVVNGLPFSRKDWISIPVCDDACHIVKKDGADCPSYVKDGYVWFEAEVGPCAASVYDITKLEEAVLPSESAEVSQISLENEYMSLTVDSVDGISLVLKENNEVILNQVKDLLVLQGDTGNFQIERIETSEQHAWANPLCIIRKYPDEVVVEGSFTDSEGHKEVDWTLTFTLHSGQPFLGLQVHTDWQAVGKRMRLKLATSLQNAGDGIYEVPFGVVRRRAYTPAFCRKGEWPTQRFAAVEDSRTGLALINNGVPGVETLGGTIYTTILRAPTEVYAGMIPDDSSQQHGEHDFSFALLPYSGTWQESEVLKTAQRWNQPLRAFAADGNATGFDSMFEIDNPAVVLSSIKQPEDGSRPGIFLRMGENIGEKQQCRIRLQDAVRAWDANMMEEVIEPLTVTDGSVMVEFKPWQIRTIYIERME